MRARGRPAPPDRMTGKAGLSACLMLCLLALPAWAQKTDIVTLVNGDTLTGEIKLLERGRLQVSTDHLGTVNIEWDKVISVTALRMFQIETSNGVRLLGQLTTTAPGQFEVIAAEAVVRPHVSPAPLIRSYALERELGLTPDRRWLCAAG